MRLNKTENSKGLAELVILAAVVLVVAIGGLVFVWQGRQEAPTPTPQVSEVNPPTPSPVSESTDIKTIESELESTIIGDIEADIDSMDDEAASL